MKTHHNIYDEAGLIRKALTGELTEDEKPLADSLLEDGRMKRVYEELSDGRVLKEELDMLSRFSGEKAYEQFCFRRQASRRRRIYRMVAVAAVCVLALGGVMWLYRPVDRQSRQIVAVAPMNPGVKQARLILASGEEVTVARGENGNIREQGVNISYENGELVYRKESGTKNQQAYNELQVPRGGECCITLDDGTKVWVNAQSSLKYPVAFLGGKREVVLEGEAFFEVTRDSRPFVVKTSYGEVKVLGTSFGVSAYGEDEVSYTTLVTGKVSVDNATAKKPVVIRPGEQVVTLKDGRMNRRKVNVEEYVGWKDGNYVFCGQRLETIMNTLQRWYNISVEYRAEELKDLLFTGSLNRYDDVNVFFNALKSTRDVLYHVEGKKVTLYKSFTNQSNL